jgi:hypothetical protein
VCRPAPPQVAALSARLAEFGVDVDTLLAAVVPPEEEEEGEGD